MARTSASLKLLAALAALVLTLGAPPASGAGSLVGRLAVESHPRGARIFVDGAPVGRAPCNVEDVGIGAVTVKAEMEGYATQSRVVKVESEALTRVRFELRRLENVGHIEVLIKPDGAQVELDRVPRGRTPLRIINVAAGTHRLSVWAEGYRTLQQDVVVVSGRWQRIHGRLAEAGGPAPGDQGPESPGAEPAQQEAIPSTEQMPEAKAFEPVRELLRRRRYEEALARLASMAQQEATRRYAVRIARDRRYVQAVQSMVESGYEALRLKVGQDYPLLLSGGIMIQGRILHVSARHVSVQAGEGPPMQIELSRIHPARVLKLAALARGQPVDGALAAVFLAMEGQFDLARQALARAPTDEVRTVEARSFVDSERLWAAAVRREKAERQAAARAQQRKEPAAPPLVLIDTYRGVAPSSAMSAWLEGLGLEVRRTDGPLKSEDLQSAAVLIILDGRREGSAVPTYDKPSLEKVLRFVRSGGGLIFFGPRSGRKRRAQALFRPLFAQLQAGVLREELRISSAAPPDYPRYGIRAVPTGPHPVTAGVSAVMFEPGIPPLSAPRAWWLMVTDGFVETAMGAQQGPFPIVAARPLGKGRVLLFASPPLELQEEPLNLQRQRLLYNGLRWVAEPKLRQRAAAR